MKLREIVAGREEFKKEKNERTDGRAGPKRESVSDGKVPKSHNKLKKKKSIRALLFTQICQ